VGLLTVCPVVHLEGEDRAFAIRGRNARYVHLPQKGEGFFADLAYMATCSMKMLRKTVREPGVDPQDDDEVTAFGRGVGRRFSRYPFPDEVVPWLSGLREIVLEKANNERSAQGLAIDQVLEFRVEASAPNRWTQAPYKLTLVLLLKDGVLLDSTDPQPISDQLNQFLNPTYRAKPMAEAIAKKLMANQLDSSISPPPMEDRVHLWFALAERWAALCVPKSQSSQPDSVKNAVEGGSFGVDLVPENEFSYARYRHSEMLDVQHLSPSYPLGD
jgi:hypothetical protein